MRRLLSLIPLLLALVFASASALSQPDAAHAQGGRMRQVGGYGYVVRDSSTFAYGSLDSQVNGTAKTGEIVYINGWQIGVYHIGDLRWIADTNVQPIIDASGQPMVNWVTRQGNQYFVNGNPVRLPRRATYVERFLANPTTSAPLIYQGASVASDVAAELVDTTQVRLSSGERVVATMRVTDYYGYSYIYLRTGPSASAPVASTRANVHEILTAYEVVDNNWYRIGPNLWAPRVVDGETLLEPENVQAYAPNAYYNGGKWISIDLDRQQLTAWEGADVVMASRIKSGKYGYHTPTGVWQTYAKIPNERMSGSDYDLMDVAWTQYFTPSAIAIHAAYWHNNYNGRPGSHGCVNTPVELAERLFNWAPLGTTVVTHNAYVFDQQDIRDARKWDRYNR